MSTYVSPSDRVLESDRAEDRKVEVTIERASFGNMNRCPWCQIGVRNHSPHQLARCEAAFQAETNRRLAGPMRVRDVSARGGAT